MKKLFTIIIALFFTGLALNLSAQAVTNGGFENWTDSITCAGWSGIHYNVPMVINVNTFVRSSDSHFGSYAIKMVTSNAMGSNFPGIAVNGTMGLTGITANTPISGIPTNLTGWYKNTPVNGDTMVIEMLLFKWNGSKRDTIGGGYIFTNTAHPYTAFDIPILIKPIFSGTTPDSCIILFSSSVSNASQLGSMLLVDDVALVGGSTVGVQSIVAETPAVSIYPNPTNGLINVSLNLNSKENTVINVYNTIGQNVYSVSVENPVYRTVSIDLTGNHSGLYFVEVKNGEKSFTKRIVLQ